MASGNITGEFDNRLSGTNGSKPVCGLTLEIVVVEGQSEREEELDEADHTCMNCVLTDMYLEAPALVTAGKTIQLDLVNERGVVMYSTGALDAISATDHPIHLQRSLMGVTTMHITTDAGVTADRTLYLGLRGV